MAKLCKHCGKYPVFGGGMCKLHQGYRVRKEPVEARYSLKRVPLSPISSKRAVDNKSYRQVCDEIDSEAIAEKMYCCFFCGGEIHGRASHHHLRGRSGKLMTDKRYIIISHNDCHAEHYHRYSVSQLLESGWYGSFLVRLRSKDEISYDKEMRKLIKHFELWKLIPTFEV